jgi:hypothetical protein
VAEGWFADLVILDPDTVGPGTVVPRQDLPANGWRLYSEATGIDATIVNGVAIVRDGNETDIRQHSEPYDEEIALGGIAWLAAVEASQTPPEPEKHRIFCRDYCEFFDMKSDEGCRGMS